MRSLFGGFLALASCWGFASMSPAELKSLCWNSLLELRNVRVWRQWKVRRIFARPVLTAWALCVRFTTKRQHHYRCRHGPVEAAWPRYK